MRILLLTQYFPPEVGAAQTRLAAMCRELKRHGHEIEVVTCFPNYPSGKIFGGYSGFSATDHWEGSRVHRFWVYASQGRTLARLWNYLSFALTACFGFWKARKPEVVFVNSGPLFLALPGVMMAGLWGVPMILNVSDLWPRSVEHLGGIGGRIFLRVAHALEKWAYERATFVNAITEGVRKILIEEKGVPAEKVLFLPNGVDTSVYAPRPKDVELEARLGLVGKFVFVYPGNHGYAHALHRVLEAAVEMQKRGDDVAFLLVGGGSEKPRLIEFARERGLKNVVFHDPVSPDELPVFLSVADAGLVHLRDSPLANETRPAKMFPLMAQALPILYCGHGEGAELLRKVNGGVVVPPEDAFEFLRGIEVLRAGLRPGGAGVTARGGGMAWGANNREYVVRELSWDRNVAEWLKEFSARSGMSGGRV